MLISRLTALAAVLTAASGFAQGLATPPLYFSPSILYVGSGPAQLHISVLQGQNTGLTARWNGADRPTGANTDPSFSGGYSVQLTAQDLAAPGMAEVTMVDAKSGAIVVSSFLFVGYNLIPNDAVFDHARNRFYLTTPAQTGDASFPPNSLVALDPTTLRIGPVLAMGNGPANMALSDDGVSLYVSVDGDGVVRRVNLDSFSVVSEFRVRSATSGTVPRSAIAVMPGNPLAVAVYTGTLAVYDNGQKRPSEFASSGGFDGLLFAPDGKSLFLGSYANFNSPQAVLRYAVDSTGVPKQTPVSLAGGGPVVVVNNILYTSRGTLIDIQKSAVVGTLGVGGSIAVDPANQRILAVYFVESAYLQDYPQYLQAFDSTTLEPLGWHSLDTWNYYNAGASPAQRLIRFGTDGLLYIGSKALLLFHTPLAGPAPVTQARAVVNAASQQGGSVAPGEIVSVYGSNLGPPSPVSAHLNESNSYDPALSHVQVWFDRTPATVLMAYQGQINAIAPFEISPGATVNLQVWNFGIPSAQIPLSVAPAAPGLFTRDGSGSGQVAIINQDGSINTPSPPGSIIVLFGSGGGKLPGAVDGALARSAQSLAGSVHVFVGGRDVPVLYAGAAPLLPNGMFQINAQLPADLPSGTAQVSVSVNGQQSPKGATVEIR